MDIERLRNDLIQLRTSHDDLSKRFVMEAAKGQHFENEIKELNKRIILLNGKIQKEINNYDLLFQQAVMFCNGEITLEYFKKKILPNQGLKLR